MVTIEKWHFARLSQIIIVGTVKQPGFNNDRTITTDGISNVDMKSRVVTTMNGSVYKLGDVDKLFVKYFMK